MTEETKALTVTVQDIRMMAEAVAKSKLFGMKTVDEAMALMLIAHAEGLHPAIAARDYNIIQGKPSKSAEAMHRSFLQLGGKIEWHELTDAKASATFSHPQGGTVRIDWDMDRAAKAGLAGKDNWKRNPRQMLRARVLSEGVRTVHPGSTSGMYTPEEVKDFDDPKGKKPLELNPGQAVIVQNDGPWTGEEVVPFKGEKWKGMKWSELGDEDLVKLIDKKDGEVKTKATLELERRLALEAEPQKTDAEDESQEVVDAEVVETAEKELFPS